MKNKSAAVIVMEILLMTVIFSGCGERTDEVLVERDNMVLVPCVEGCTCTGCICCGTDQAPGSTMPEEDAQPASGDEQQTETAELAETADLTETQSADEDIQEPLQTQDDRGVRELSEGELAARRAQQANFAAARETLYSLPNSLDKTTKINQMDRQILANNAYDFSGKSIVFIGDSITEGIEGAIDDNGNFVSYVTYANSYLHFGYVLNNGKGGRMFADYGGEEYSLVMNFSRVTNVDTDIIVVFAGINDYLSAPAGKRFGNIDITWSTAGYCGAVRQFMKQLKEYYSDREIFFVIMYDIPQTVDCDYSDVDGQLTLNDYLEVQRKLAKEYGFQIIELYDIGFMDCTDAVSSDYYLRDGIHPKDNGNIALGEHIAAELSLYFGQKYSD